ncbi:MAG: hypothetical protein LBN04_11765 [Oscillospiraceae bacterium]|jgi:hypothetical protein|nr:hypothetical protein [Oscillospiraceae bacterium]
MRKILLLCLALLWLPLMANAQAAPAPQVDWAWLVDQVASGAETVTLPNSIVSDGTPLVTSGQITLQGNGYTLTGAVLEGGTFLLRNVTLQGVHGLADEAGGAGLTLRGTGAIAMLSNGSRALGGRSGPEGERGGAGICLEDKRQGLILTDTASAQGGVGRLYGGDGLLVLGCEARVAIDKTASLSGNAALAEGGAGLRLPGCAVFTMDGYAFAVGGESTYTGGAGLCSLPCEACAVQGSLDLAGDAMVMGGVGNAGGTAVHLERAELGDATDLTLREGSALIGGDGETAGVALAARGARIALEGDATLQSGSYFIDAGAKAALSLTDSALTPEGYEGLPGVKLKQYPASGVSAIIQAELSEYNPRQVTPTVENGLTTRELSTRFDKLRVEKGRAMQAAINGSSLRITLRDQEYMERLDFEQRLSGDGGEGEGARLVIIAAKSLPGYTLESTTAALRKLETLGVTQLALTSIDPVYYERIWDVAALLKAVDASEDPVARLLLGTADDAVIFELEAGDWQYQEGLMAEVIRPLEEQTVKMEEETP